MAYWLADERNGQHFDWLQRFDPRFWTVNFPRPMMASLVDTAADALRVDCEFHHRGELAGVIWESEDTLDHPLLAYETKRDYSRTTLRFRWRSDGILPLDALNGPTLTIEGRDASGTTRSWYVRLWNYAEGSPSDARIVLPFSDLQSGFSLPGETVHPSDIDRMFISLAPAGYVEGSTARLDSRVDGWAELSEIVCEGHNAVLKIGDILLPDHGEQLATAYDDAFNQSPARLVRAARGLGYRGRLLHYIGMSHFFRLVADSEGLSVDREGTLCEPARRWHRRYFEECAARGYEAIVSLSYELFAARCPAAWQQRAFDGTPGRTGWEPPSALLSPANDEAMEWLRGLARQFVRLMEDAGLPVLFQIGEPWWWLMPDRRPCLYDAAARDYFENAPEIADLAQPLNAEQTDLLDRAGELLARSTLDLAAAVREEAEGAAEILLLAFTPTIFGANMPELARANLPLGWAFPAFDRLQLEDYDWLTSGAGAERRAAYRAVDERLAYPVDRQDYLSGFVLDPADAEAFWQRIDDGLDEAAERGIAQRFVWAMPQVARDGYTRLPRTKEDNVQAFDDILYPLALGRDVSVSPQFSTSVAVTASGHERRNALWSDARLAYDVGPGIRSEEELGILLRFFRARHGPASGFRLRDPFDFSSNGLIDPLTAFDQIIGTGDGTASVFRLTKDYDGQVRNITRPDVASIRVSIDGIETSEWTYAEGGRILLDSAPSAGAIVRAGFLFDVPVRFAEDRLDLSSVAFKAGEAPSVPLVEIREDA
ncbi:TIGR02217 family protein [Altererythrobacter aurantiacus]|uniref:TIGR02217 family protein n=1 Tax=Parapontixanthobacter aurantiacus TaxID=1463599 RepID=A0A844ZGQ4_9SPHN|nr:DUF2460 domain-containing protein [Parapontixanthobacter aurantiacus]MXO86170.1 TIGR02217 family protein [Parapontixanthobacter aurantiacus]